MAVNSSVRMNTDPSGRPIYPGSQTGIGAPTHRPTAIGQTYVDTDTLNVYISAGTSGAYNWAFVGKGLSSDFTTTTVPNIFAWWSADYGITKDGGDLVSSWADKVNGWAIVNTGGTDRPLFASADTSFNGQPSLAFDGSNDYLELNHTETGNAFTYFSVFSVDQVYTDVRVFDYHGAYAHLGAEKNPSQFIVGTSSFTDMGTYSTSTKYLISMRATGAGGVMYAQVNNGAVTSVATGYTSAVDSTRFGSYWGGTYATKCRIAESITYNANLSDANIAIVKAYLNNKYAIY